MSRGPQTQTRASSLQVPLPYMVPCRACRLASGLVVMVAEKSLTAHYLKQHKAYYAELAARLKCLTIREQSLASVTEFKGVQRDPNPGQTWKE